MSYTITGYEATLTRNLRGTKWSNAAHFITCILGGTVSCYLATLLEAKAEVDALIIHSGESDLFSPHFFT